MTPTQPILSRAPFRWFLYLVAWALLGLVVSSVVPLGELLGSLPRPVAGSIAELVVMLYALGFLVPLPVLVCNVAPLGRSHRVRSLAVHILAAVAFVALHWWIVHQSMESFMDFPRAFRGMGRGRGPGPDRMWGEHARITMQIARYALTSMTGYWLVVGVWHAVDASRRLRERETHAAHLEAQLATARLQALEDQLHPHFLFNTLNTVSSLIYEDAQAADKVIRDLSTLLRLALDNAGRHTVPLGDEMRFVEVYLDIMKTRYPGRLDVTRDVAADTASVPVPNLLLQPIVENSIKHGLEAVDGVIAISIAAVAEGGRLRVEVCDNGPGLPDGPAEALREGVGLRNTRDRLAQLYGDDCDFAVENREGGGVRVRVDVPLAPKGAS